MTGWLGLALFPVVGVTMIATGLPAYLVLIGAAALGACIALASGNGMLLTALPGRYINLFESDLLQALPLFVLMGMLIYRLPLANILFRAGCVLLGRSAAAPAVSALGLGALLAPMNGSVGASVAVLSRSIRPMLARADVPASERVALLAAASTLGVVIPPSLVLILLGDAMMAAHTIAANATGRMDRIVNTQDIFRAAFAPAALTLVAWLALAYFGRRKAAKAAAPPSISATETLAALLTVGFILTVLGGVTMGFFYPVEAAAMGCVTLFTAAAVTRRLDRAMISTILTDAIAISGSLFALLLAATSFTLILRILGTDRLLIDLIAALPGGPGVALATALAIIMASALVLDAFEIIFVVVPVVMPGVLMRAPDAAWVAALTILALQASYLIPPLGYATMMTRSAEPEAVTSRRLAGALAPYLGALVLVILLALAFPGLTRLGAPQAAPAAAPAALREFIVPMPDDDPPPPNFSLPENAK